ELRISRGEGLDAHVRARGARATIDGRDRQGDGVVPIRTIGMRRIVDRGGGPITKVPRPKLDALLPGVVRRIEELDGVEFRWVTRIVIDLNNRRRRLNLNHVHSQGSGDAATGGHCLKVVGGGVRRGIGSGGESEGLESRASKEVEFEDSRPVIPIEVEVACVIAYDGFDAE